MSLAVVAVASLLLGAHPDPRFRAGVVLHDAGKLQESIGLFRAVLKDRPHDPAAVYELSFTLLVAKQYEAAIAVIEAELKSGFTQTPRLYAVQANAYDALGKAELAEAALRKGLKADPKNPELAYTLGVNLGSRERWPEAIAAFQTCADLEPSNPSGWWGLGRAYEAQHDDSAAVAAYARAALTRSERSRIKAAAQRVVALSQSAEGLIRVLQEQDTWFGAAREQGHLEALAYELRRLGGDASAELWCAEHPEKVTAFRAWFRSRT